MFWFLYFQFFLALTLNTFCSRSGPGTLSVSVSSITYLNYFFTRCLYFHYYWWWERRKNQFPKYLWPILLKFEEKIVEIHRYSCLSITWIPQKIDPQTKPCWRHSSNQTASGTGPLCAKPIHSITRTLIVLNKIRVLS